MRNWYAPSTRPSATAATASGASTPLGAAWASVVASVVTLLAAACDRRRGAAEHRRAHLVTGPDTDEQGEVCAQTVRGHRDRLTGLAREACFLDEATQPAVERAVDDVRAGAEDALGEHRDREHPGTHRIRRLRRDGHTDGHE